MYYHGIELIESRPQILTYKSKRDGRLMPMMIFYVPLGHTIAHGLLL